MQGCGSTAIFDALNKACNLLTELRQRYSRTKCRIILLTDGEDNRSTSEAFEASNKLYEQNVVLDAIVLGTKSTEDLFKVVKNTGTL